MRHTLARRLADGIPARLEFDYICQRAHFFGEHYLHGIINEVVSANISPEHHVPRAGYPHPALRSTRGGAGRKPEVDLFVEPRTATGGPTTCIEAKWAGSSHCSPREVLVDLCRLTLVKEHSPTTICLFVLAGGNDDIARLFSKTLMMPGDRHGRMLQAPSAKRVKVPKPRLYVPADRIPQGSSTRGALRRLPAIPSSISTTLVVPGVINTPRWRTLIWEVGQP